MNKDQFQMLVQTVTDAVADHEITVALGDELEHLFPPSGADFKAIEASCHKAIEAGWMCAQGDEGRRFGRVLEASPETGGFSVDVVDLKDIVGPHHEHPKGEICMIMPRTPAARFDGKGRGWKTYPPGSEHFPTVTNGEALVLYLLPDGEIRFTGKSPTVGS